MFPFTRFKIQDRSMEPNFKEGDYVLIRSYIFSKPRKGDVVVIKHNGRFLLKRINKTENNKYIVHGDNRKFNSPVSISKEKILGKVLLHARR